MKENKNPSTHAPQKEGSFLPRLKDVGILSRLCEHTLPDTLSSSLLGINILLNSFLTNGSCCACKVGTRPHRRQLEQKRKLFTQNKGCFTFTFFHNFCCTYGRKAPHKQMNVIWLKSQSENGPTFFLALLLK